MNQKHLVNWNIVVALVILLTSHANCKYCSVSNCMEQKFSMDIGNYVCSYLCSDITLLTVAFQC